MMCHTILLNSNWLKDTSFKLTIAETLVFSLTLLSIAPVYKRNIQIIASPLFNGDTQTFQAQTSEREHVLNKCVVEQRLGSGRGRLICSCLVAQLCPYVVLPSANFCCIFFLTLIRAFVLGRVGSTIANCQCARALATLPASSVSASCTITGPGGRKFFTSRFNECAWQNRKQYEIET